MASELAYQIVQQPDGRFAIWNGAIDSFVMLNCSAEEVVDIVIGREARWQRAELEKAVKNPSMLPTKWQQCLARYWMRYRRKWFEAQQEREADSVNVLTVPKLLDAIRWTRASLEGHLDAKTVAEVFSLLDPLLENGWDPSAVAEDEAPRTKEPRQ